MTHQKYILDETGRPVAEPDLEKWAAWFQAADRKVARELIGASVVSTIFLALDHDYTNTGPPVLWETMVFGGPLSQEMDRCIGSREQAEAMHARMVERVKNATAQKSGRS